MLTYIGVFIVGLVVGWNFLEQPMWVKRLVGKAQKETTKVVDQVKDEINK